MLEKLQENLKTLPANERAEFVELFEKAVKLSPNRRSSSRRDLMMHIVGNEDDKIPYNPIY